MKRILTMLAAPLLLLGAGCAATPTQLRSEPPAEVWRAPRPAPAMALCLLDGSEAAQGRVGRLTPRPEGLEVVVQADSGPLGPLGPIIYFLVEDLGAEGSRTKANGTYWGQMRQARKIAEACAAATTNAQR